MGSSDFGAFVSGFQNSLCSRYNLLTLTYMLQAGIAHQDFAGHKGTIRNGNVQVDFDLGNYEHLLDVTFSRDNNITTAKMYQSVLEKERRGDYLGKIVQVVTHITDAIKTWIESVSVIHVNGKEGPADVCVIEFGTGGDIESMPFIEALCCANGLFQLRQRWHVGHED
ncbi:hypothetical protein ACFX1X_036256 [Malus domestica]